MRPARWIGLLMASSVVLASTFVSADAGTRPEAGTPVAARGTPPPPAPDAGYNVVTILTDDMNDVSCQDTAKYFPRSGGQLLQGTCYENARVASPVCCPSRAAYLTGQLPHNNRVRTIEDGMKLTVQDTVQYRLREAGISTYGVGKWLNGVSFKELADPGYDTGFSAHDFWKPRRYRDYDVVGEDGEVGPLRPMVHTTLHTGDLLDGFVEESLERGDRFYAYGSFMAPHSQHVTRRSSDELPEATLANRHRPVPPFDYRPEIDTSDKLPVFQQSHRGREYYERVNAARVRALYDVDQQIDRLFTTLREHDALDDTVVFVTSDNGYQLGQNNWEYKGTPYAGSLDVPLLAYYPDSISSPPVVRSPVNLLDLAPTLYDLFEVTPTTLLDGVSLLAGHEREAEYYEITNLGTGDETGRGGLMPSWAEIVSNGRAYIQFYSRRGRLLREEFYADPGYQRNLLHRSHAGEAPSKATLNHYRALLTRARTCAGTTAAGAPNPCP